MPSGIASQLGGRATLAGVRFRAWHPAHCLQPTIAPDTPLVSGLAGGWSGRSIGGAAIMWPIRAGARATFPVNALEAETAGAVRDAGAHARAGNAARSGREPVFPVHGRHF